MKVALIGCGRISKKHCEAITKTGCELVGVCDIVDYKAKAVASNYSVPSFSDYHAMIRDTAPDMVSILTEAGNHARIALDIAKYDIAVLVEKPMALRLDDAEKMVSAYADRPLFVVKQNRYNDPIRSLKRAIDNNDIGKLVMATARVRWCRSQDYFDTDPWRGTWAYDGGVFASQASHYVDLVQWLMGPVKTVYAKGKTQLLNIEVEDTGVAVIEFANGALGIIEATNAARPENLEGSISVLGSNGAVVIGGKSLNKIEKWAVSGAATDEHHEDIYGNGHIRLYEDLQAYFDNSGKGKSIYLADAKQGLEVVRLINAIYDSIESSAEVTMNHEAKNRLGYSNRPVIYKENKIGANLFTGHYVLIRGNNIIGNNVSIGSYTEIAHSVVIEDGVRIHSMCFIPEGTVIKAGAWIGPRVTFVNDVYPQTGGKYRQGAVVDSGAIVGANSTIMAGVTIGKGAVIGCGSVVTKDVPADEVWVGNPAKFLKRKDSLDAYSPL